MKFADVIQTADWKSEKHVPVIEAPNSVKTGEKFVAKLCVGKEIAHPNTMEHHIRWIQLFFKPDNGKFAIDLGRFSFGAHGESTEGANKGPAFTDPTVDVILKIGTSGTLMATSYCNIHGMWENSKPIVVEN